MRGAIQLRNCLAIAGILFLSACVERPEQTELQLPESAAVADPLATGQARSQASPHTSAPELEAALQNVVRGPTEAERAGGAQSWFSEETADVLISAVVDAAGHAIVDFRDLRTLIPNASSSAGSEMLLSELNATVFAFPDIRSVEYRINGSCDVFGDWLQYGCRAEIRP